MKLKKLLKDIPGIEIKGAKDLEITGICTHSRRAAPGNLFIARRGKKSDGAAYIPEALNAGASAVLTDIYDPTLKNAVQLVHPDVAFCEAAIAAAFYQDPSRELFTVGITGTNGKTTTAHLVKALLDEGKHLCGMIGTVAYVVGSHRYAAEHTTPDVVLCQKLLREMVREGCKAAALEVSSHALDQGRVKGIHFDVAVFTNLTQEHLDYHGTMEAYAAAKNLLFREGVKTAVVNADCPWHEKVLEGCRSKVLKYGIENPADLMAGEVRLMEGCTVFSLRYEGREHPVKIPFVGRHNVYNCLAAFAACLSKGCTIEELAEKVQNAPQVSGRLERVENGRGLNIFVDYAHTPDALENVVRCLDELKKGRIIVVFGCGGDRDRQKRPLMAKAVENAGAYGIVTSDNPRSEEPEAIIREIVSGFSKEADYDVEVDRREAIAKAVGLAAPEDIVLIAGKGHETRQIFAYRTIDFDDRSVAKEICGEKCITV